MGSGGAGLQGTQNAEGMLLKAERRPGRMLALLAAAAAVTALTAWAVRRRRQRRRVWAIKD